VRGNFLADHVEEVVSACVTQELEPFPQVGDCLLEVAMGPEVALEGAVLLGQLEHGLGIVNGGLDLLAVPHDPGVLDQPVDVGWIERSDPFRIEAEQRLLEPVPFGLDHLPADAGLENRLGHDL